MRNHSPPSTSLSERIFRRLLVLYPRAFRTAYQEAMLQLFRDQIREASPLGSRALLALWLRTVPDLCLTASRERLLQLAQFMNASLSGRLLRWPDFTFGKIFAALLLIMAAVHAFSLVMLPRIYRGLARVEVQRPGAAPTYDPYFMQTQFERIRSQKVLTEVAEELALPRHFAAERGVESLTTQEAVGILRQMINLRQSRNTSLIEVQAFDGDPRVAAAIANKIPEVFQRLQTTTPAPAAVEVIDPAEPMLRAIRPNIPLNIALGVLLIPLLAAILAGLLRLCAKLFTRPQAV